MKITITESIQLNEVSRRIKQFKAGDINADLHFLGMPNEVKSLVKKNILTPYGGRERKKVLNWYNLTEFGKTIINQY